jgi:hypothetical protein
MRISGIKSMKNSSKCRDPFEKSGIFPLQSGEKGPIPAIGSGLSAYAGVV